MNTFCGVLIPFLGTTLGSACVFSLRKALGPRLNELLLGLAGGVMIAASLFSLLLPSIQRAAHWGRLSFLPAAVGFLLGAAVLMALDHVIPYLRRSAAAHRPLSRTTMLILAITLHNVPEGMAVGAAFAGAIAGAGIPYTGAMALALGVAIQNIPEGAILSLPLKSEGCAAGRAFALGTLSGVVEPLAAGLTLLLSRFVTPALPYLLSFAAGAMVYVVIEELIPESAGDGHSDAGKVGFALGFLLMMILDVALG